MEAVWILGATGRIGRAVAARLVADGLAVVLVGRDAARLHRVAETLENRPITRIIASLSEMAAAVAEQRPTVVLNMIGPFTHTARVIASACAPGTHYVDLSNELPSFLDVMDLHEHAVAAGSTFVTGAGFGVLATESVVLTLCKDRPPANRVRCAAIPAAETEPGPLGEAFAASITQGIALGGRQYEAGRLVRTPLFGDFKRISLPDGRIVGTASAPTGELEAARRASGAPFAISATSMVPSAAIVRAMVPAVLAVLSIPPVLRFATRKIAAIEIKPTNARTLQVSWSHASVAWSSGATMQGWMRTGDAMVFTADVMAKIAIRLMEGKAAPGVYTPGALFGAELANACGGEVIVDADVM